MNLFNLSIYALYNVRICHVLGLYEDITLVAAEYHPRPPRNLHVHVAAMYNSRILLVQHGNSSDRRMMRKAHLVNNDPIMAVVVLELILMANVERSFEMSQRELCLACIRYAQQNTGNTPVSGGPHRCQCFVQSSIGVALKLDKGKLDRYTV